MSILKKAFNALFVEKDHEEKHPVIAPVEEPGTPPPAPSANPPPIPETVPQAPPKQDADEHISDLERSAKEVLKKDEEELASPQGPPKKPSFGVDDAHRENAIKKLLTDLETLKEQSWHPPPPFHLTSGITLHSVDELRDACDDMSQDVFDHHVSPEQNDFSTWIEEGHGDRELAGRVRQAKNPRELKEELFRETALPELPELDEEASSSLDKDAEPAKKDSFAEPDFDVSELDAHDGEMPLSQEELVGGEKHAEKHAATPKTADQEQSAHEQPDTTVSEAQEAYQAEIAALREELALLRTALSEELAAGVEALKHEHDEHERLRIAFEEELKEREDRLAAQEEQLATNMQHFLEEREQAQKLLEQADSVRVELDERRTELSKTEKAVAERQADIARAQKELAALEKALEERKQSLVEHERNIQEQSFSQYAQEKLADVSIHTDIQQRSTGAEHILGLVRGARNALERGDLDAAKRAYSTVREQFYKAQLQDDEHHELYNLIRELYTDIELRRLK